MECDSVSSRVALPRESVSETLVVSDADRERLDEFDKLAVEDSESVSDSVIETCCETLSEYDGELDDVNSREPELGEIERLGDLELVPSVEGVLLGDADSVSSSDELRDRDSDDSNENEGE